MLSRDARLFPTTSMRRSVTSSGKTVKKLMSWVGTFSIFNVSLRFTEGDHGHPKRKPPPGWQNYLF